MLSVTEGFVLASATAAKRKRRLAGQVEFVAFGIDKFDLAFGAFYSQWTVLLDRNFYRHDASGRFQ
jgi:hypothetical protein